MTPNQFILQMLCGCRVLLNPHVKYLTNMLRSCKIAWDCSKRHLESLSKKGVPSQPIIILILGPFILFLHLSIFVGLPKNELDQIGGAEKTEMWHL